ncbi:uncharacterized protein ColSpa_12679 [Colletotrichum spaethianum]|uniref:Uncharacterized protein n=1 Tax=Colletotrichum spaethianum TaxID=700344 RepID=A0AA37PHX6_9PEZI|nr:uncharacterized protein ColSpa_12679 [Colletotrichum spaethianum]GKT52498.1 hypothetical protein ColSpa_12679 [Colletotrichum spaethianum]
MDPIHTIRIASEPRIPIPLTDATIARDRLPSRLQAWADSSKSPLPTLANFPRPRLNGALYPGDYPSSIEPGYMTGEQLFAMDTSPQTRHQALPHHRNSRPRLRRSRRSADHSALLAIGSWSSPDIHLGDHYGDRSAPSRNKSDFASRQEDESYEHASYDDFILFPDEIPTDTHEDVSAYTEQPSAPLAPRIPRLRTPDLAPLSTDVQFFPCHGDEAEEDRINEAWYLAGRERVHSQMDEAMAYMSIVEGRRRTLKN